MSRKSIMLVFGTRPEAIKMAPLIHCLQEKRDIIDVKVCVTSQHREMLDQVLSIFEIKPDIDLNIMKPGQDLYDVTSHVILGMRDVLKKYTPDLVLVHGDTTTSFAATMAAFYAGILVGHVEAGLRTHSISAPFPEEFNRQVTSRIAKWHFAPTQLSYDNLLKENIESTDIFITGNTVIDALHWVLDRIQRDQCRTHRLKNELDLLVNFKWQETPFVLITGHRRENFGEGFLHICDAIQELAHKYPSLHFIYPVHLNPNVQEPVSLRLQGYANIHLIKPLTYEPFVYLLKYSYLVLTDSGGIQEEAPSLGKPVLVMRDVTERPEAVTAGTVKLVGADTLRIVTGVSELVDNKARYVAMSKAHNPYGDGNSSQRITDILVHWASAFESESANSTLEITPNEHSKKAMRAAAHGGRAKDAHIISNR